MFGFCRAYCYGHCLLREERGSVSDSALLNRIDLLEYCYESGWWSKKMSDLVRLDKVSVVREKPRRRGRVKRWLEGGQSSNFLGQFESDCSNF